MGQEQRPRLEGYRACLVDPDSELVMATAAAAGNVGYAMAATGLRPSWSPKVEGTRRTDRRLGGSGAGQRPRPSVSGDSAYGTGPLVASLATTGIDPRVKVSSSGAERHPAIRIPPAGRGRRPTKVHADKAYQGDLGIGGLAAVAADPDDGVLGPFPAAGESTADVAPTDDGNVHALLPLLLIPCPPLHTLAGTDLHGYYHRPTATMPPATSSPPDPVVVGALDMENAPTKRLLAAVGGGNQGVASAKAPVNSTPTRSTTPKPRSQPVSRR